MADCLKLFLLALLVTFHETDSAKKKKTNVKIVTEVDRAVFILQRDYIH